MIEKTGTGSQSVQALYTSTLPRGFYTLGFELEASVPTGSPTPLVALQITTSQPPSTTAVVTASQPKAHAVLESLFLEPGDVINYAVSAVNFGANPPPGWTVRTWVYAAADVAH